MSMLIRC